MKSLSLSRKTKSKLNAITGIMSSVIVAFLTFLFIRFTIKYFLDDVNGFIRVAMSIVSYANLAEGMIGMTVVFLLYSPIVKKDNEKTNAVLSITNLWMKVLGIIYIISLLILALLLPIVISSKDRSSTFSSKYLFLMTILIGAGISFSYFVSGKYVLLMNAQNNKFIASIIQIIIEVIVMTTILVLMSKHHTPKTLLIYISLISLKVVLIGSIATLYVKLKNSWIKLGVYDKNINKEFKQKIKSSLIHQIAYLIVFSTDEITLAIYSHSVGATESLIIISVYSSYLMLGNFASKIISLMITSFESQIGLEISEGKFISKNFISFEQKSTIWLIFCSSVLFMLMPQYIETLFNANKLPEYFSYKISLLITIIIILKIVRLPSQILIETNGHFKETKWRAVIEAGINLSLSLTLVWFMGIYGVLLATVISFSYRTIDMFVYTSRFLGPNSGKQRIINIILVVIQITLLTSIAFTFNHKFSFYELIMFTIITIWSCAILSLGVFKVKKIINRKTAL